MGKYDVARDIYEMGIGKVTPTDDEYPVGFHGPLSRLHQSALIL